MSKNIWIEEWDKEFELWMYKERAKAFFRQKFKEAFDEVERRSFKDKEYSNFRIIGDETFNEIKEKYIK